MDDPELQPLCPDSGDHRLPAQHGSCSKIRQLIVVLSVALVLCAAVDWWKIRAPPQEVVKVVQQMKFEKSEPETPAALDTCIVTLLMEETCLRPAVVFMVVLLLLLLVLCISEAFHCCCCDRKPSSSSLPEVEQLINGKEQLDEILRRKSIRFLGEEWKEETSSDAEIEEKIMRSWDVSVVDDNLELVDQVVRIMNDYPGLILHITAFTITKLNKKDKTGIPDLVKGAFSKDFSEDFPYERMDFELAYAHGRVLSLKRLLGHKHISHRRIKTSMEHGKERKLVLSLEIPS